MRVEPHGIDSIVHAVKRGARGLDIVKDDFDRKDFAKLLFYANDAYNSNHWRRDVADMPPFQRPGHWPERKPLVKILAWTLMPNHFHLILQSIIESGIPKFMQRLCGSMSVCANMKYGGTGSIFQGGYKGRVVESEADLRYLSSYVLVKNVFELLSEGLEQNTANFDAAWKSAAEYEYSSFKTLALERESPIVDIEILRELFATPEEFKQASQDMLFSYYDRRDTDFLFE